jgi:hypothetical protein
LKEEGRKEAYRNRRESFGLLQRRINHFSDRVRIRLVRRLKKLDT